MFFFFSNNDNFYIEAIFINADYSKNKHVSALLDGRHCTKLQSCAISKKTNDATLRKWQKP